MRPLATQAVRGAVWNLLGTLANQILRFSASIVVARYLMPAEVAVGGLALVVIGLFQVLTAKGFAQALIQQPETSADLVDSVFWTLTLLSCFVAGAAWLSSWIAASYFPEPALEALVPWLAAGLMFGVVGSVPSALLQRRMQFFKINVILVMSGVVSSVVSIALAIGGFGYYAMLVPGVVSVAVTTIGFFVAARYWPRFVVRWHEFRKVHAFGFSELGTSFVGFLNDNVDYLIMSTFWSKATFGQYYFAFERAREPFNLLYVQVSQVLFPAFSRINKERRETLRGAYLRSTSIFCLLMFPLHVALISYADVVIPAIFGEQWRPAVPVFQVFAAAAFFHSVAAVVPPMMLALNRAQLNLVFNCVRLIATIPALLVMGVMGCTMLTVAWVLLTIWIVQAPIYIGCMYRLIELKASTAIHHLRRIVIAAIAMMGTVVLMRRLEGLTHWEQWLNMTIGGSASSGLVDDLVDALLGMCISSGVFAIVALSDIREAITYLYRTFRSNRAEIQE